MAWCAAPELPVHLRGFGLLGRLRACGRVVCQEERSTRPKKKTTPGGGGTRMCGAVPNLDILAGVAARTTPSTCDPTDWVDRMWSLPVACKKKLLISHVRACKATNCVTCRKLRERVASIRSQRAAAQGAGGADPQETTPSSAETTDSTPRSQAATRPDDENSCEFPQPKRIRASRGVPSDA